MMIHLSVLSIYIYHVYDELLLPSSMNFKCILVQLFNISVLWCSVFMHWYSSSKLAITFNPCSPLISILGIRWQIYVDVSLMEGNKKKELDESEKCRWKGIMYEQELRSTEKSLVWNRIIITCRLLGLHVHVWGGLFRSIIGNMGT